MYPFPLINFHLLQQEHRQSIQRIRVRNNSGGRPRLPTFGLDITLLLLKNSHVNKIGELSFDPIYAIISPFPFLNIMIIKAQQ